MKYYVYVIRCREGRFYIGHTCDLEKRLRQHNDGYSFWTSRYSGWELIYKEEFDSRTEALKRERYLKSLKGGIKFKSIIGLFK